MERRLGELDGPARDSFMLSLLKDAQEQTQPVMLALREAAFVPTPGGQLRHPSQLYNSANQRLQALLDPNTSFPTAAFADDTQVGTKFRIDISGYGGKEIIDK